MIADRRSHVQTGEASSYTHDFLKIVRQDRYLVYNHGYNRNGDQDWKLRQADLTPSIRNPVYAGSAAPRPYRCLSMRVWRRSTTAFLNATLTQ